MTLRREALPPQLGASVLGVLALATVIMVAVALAAVPFAVIRALEDEAAVVEPVAGPEMEMCDPFFYESSLIRFDGTVGVTLESSIFTFDQRSLPRELFRITADGRLVFPEAAGP